MKTISQIAKECGLTFYTVQRIVVEEKITTIQASTQLNLTEIQADYIQQVLHNKGYFQFLTLESKMNYL